MSRYLIEEQPIVVQPTLIFALGYTRATILQQIYWWCGVNAQKNQNYKEGFHWVYNSREGWAKQFWFLHERTVWDSLGELRKMGVVVAEILGDDPRDRTLWYRVDSEKLAEVVEECLAEKRRADEEKALMQAKEAKEEKALMHPPIKGADGYKEAVIRSDIHPFATEGKNSSAAGEVFKTKTPEREEQKEKVKVKTIRAAANEKPKKEKKPRERNPFFDAVVVGCGGDPDGTTSALSPRVGRAVKGLREAGYTVEDVPKIVQFIKTLPWYKPNMIAPETISREAAKWKQSVKPVVGSLFNQPAFDMPDDEEIARNMARFNAEEAERLARNGGY